MKRLFFTVCLLAAGLFGARAQMTLTLDEALRIALSENPTIRVADLEVERYDYVKRQTWGNLLPQLSVDGTYSRSIVKQEMAKGLSFGADNTLTATGTISLPLFVPTIYRTLKMNRRQAEAAVEAARASRIDLVAEVKKAFFNILLAEQSLEVLRESQATVQRTVDDTRVQYENGLASEYDLLTAEVQLSNLNPTILQTENSIALAKLMLKMYLSLPEEVEIAVAGRLDDLRDQVLAGGERFSTDLSENSQLRSLDIQAEVLAMQLKTVNAGRMPTVAAFGNATITGNDMPRLSFGDMMGGSGGTGAGMMPASSSFWWQHPISAGIQISIPIFSGLTKSSQARSIRNQMQQLDLQREYAREGVRVELEAAINNLLTARETMFAQERTVAQADKAYSISDTRYRAGAGTILELNSAQLAMTQAHLSFSQAIYDYLAAKAEYDRIVGRTE